MRQCTVELLRTTSKIVSLGKCGQISSARKLFEEMPQRDSVAWNAMLTSYVHLGIHQEALFLFRRMKSCDVSVDHYTLTAVLSACADDSELSFGSGVHALSVVSGHRWWVPVGNALLDMYGKCWRPCCARRVFEEMSFRNQVTWCSLLFAHMKSCEFEAAEGVFSAMPKRVVIAWNVMISGYAKHREVKMCLGLFREMLESCSCPDQWTFSALMSVCAEELDFRSGRMVHCFVVKSGWSSAQEATNSVLSFYAELGYDKDVMRIYDESSGEWRSQVSWNAVIDANMKLGNTEEALIAFQRAPENGVVSWTCMVSGYARNGRAEEAVSFFVNMMRRGIKPDDFAFGAVLYACSNLAVLGHGKMVHGSLVRHGFDAYVYVGNGLVNMYAKCGDLEGSSRAFGQISHKDLISWNAILFAFGLHGNPNGALKYFKQMVANGVKPDKVTFIGLFMTCSHAGLIEQCRELFEIMRSIHELSIEAYHVACLVDMLRRGGHLAEARELNNKYLETISQDHSFREARPVPCYSRQDIRLWAYLGNTLQNMAPRKEINYVLLSNLYCASGQWKEAETVRKAMLDEGVKKMPGCSWIEVRNKVTTFVAGNSSYPLKAEIYQMLNALEFEMRNPSFTGFVSRI